MAERNDTRSKSLTSFLFGNLRFTGYKFGSRREIIRHVGTPFNETGEVLDQKCRRYNLYYYEWNFFIKSPNYYDIYFIESFNIDNIIII